MISRVVRGASQGRNWAVVTATAFAATVMSAALLCGIVYPKEAFADVRKADIVYGESVEARGLAVAQCPSIDAEYALVMDADGTVYFERNAADPTQIASITKIMTAIVALEAAGDNASELQITVSEDAASIGESSANLQAGDTLSFDAALKALMVPSGNDAAVALAENLGDQCECSDDTLKGYDRFVQAMNDKAAELGCSDTIFTNPHGLDFGEYEDELHSCAADVATITRYAMQNGTFREIVAGGSTTISVTREGIGETSVSLETTDEFLDMYEYACGVKTGVTDLAGPSFVGAASKDGREVYAVVIHSSSEGQRFLDAQELCEWVYEHEISYTLANSDETFSISHDGDVIEAAVVAEVAHQDWINKTVKATLSDPDAAIRIFDLNGNISQTIHYDEVRGNIHVGDKVGSITFTQRNQVVAEYDLIACEEVYAPGFLEGVSVWWKRLISKFTGESTVAESVTLNQLPYVNDKTAGN